MSDESSTNSSLDEVYEHIWAVKNDGPFAVLDQSLEPRGPEYLYELVAHTGIDTGRSVLDVGSGLGRYTCELARRFGCRVTGLDLVAANGVRARRTAVEAALVEQIAFAQGGIEQLPFAEATFDLIWCRDMLPHLPDLGPALAECARVAKPDGWLLLYTTFATPLLEPGEQAHLGRALSVVEQSMDQACVEGAIARTGWRIERAVNLGSEEWEFTAERAADPAKGLLRLARMRRQRARYIAALGAARYELALAVYQWDAYLMLGKLAPFVYLLRPGPGSGA